MMNDELRKDNNRFTGARVLVSTFAFLLSKKIDLILDNVYGERLYNTTKGPAISIPLYCWGGV